MRLVVVPCEEIGRQWHRWRDGACEEHIVGWRDGACEEHTVGEGSAIPFLDEWVFRRQ